MNRTRKAVLAALAVAAGAASWFGYAVVAGRPPTIDLFFERVFLRFALDNPELLTSLRLLESWGIDFHNDDLTDASDVFEQRQIARVESDLAILRSYDETGLSDQQQLSARILDWFLDDLVRGKEFMYHDYPVNQLGGVQNELPTFMATMHQIHSDRDAHHYIARLKKFPLKFDQVIQGLRTRESKGILPPRFVVDRVLKEMNDFVATPATANILYTSAADKLEESSVAGRDRLLEDIAAAIETSVYPSYAEMIAYFETLRPKTTTDDGVWKHPNGEAYYAHALRSHTTTAMTPDEVHNLGLAEVARVQSEMLAILSTVGFDGKPLGQAMQELGRDTRFLYPDTEAGKQQCLDDYQRIIDEINGGLGDAFHLRPKAGVRVEPVPAFREKTAPGAYYNSPALDGSRPGIFFANLRSMGEIPKFGMRTLAYHEAIPGHHFQIALQQEISGVPTFRRVVPFTAYSEGWALYAERLAWELGFQTDPYDNLGRLQAELFRCVRLVVDTGIHHKRWTREQAIAYMMENTGMPEGDVTAEIERYIVNPGQACAYKVGMIRILELREKAKAELGERFTLGDFHDIVLMNGAMPLDILEQAVNQYIDRNKA